MVELPPGFARIPPGNARIVPLKPNKIHISVQIRPIFAGFSTDFCRVQRHGLDHQKFGFCLFGPPPQTSSTHETINSHVSSITSIHYTCIEPWMSCGGAQAAVSSAFTNEQKNKARLFEGTHARLFASNYKALG